MKRIISLVAVLAVAATAPVAFGVLAATTASALPEFKGLGAVKDIHFTGEGGLTALLAARGGVEGKVECHKVLVSGLLLVPSMLVDNILLHFHTGCEQKGVGNPEKCNEPILTKPLHGVLGWTNNVAPPVGILLKPESGTEFASVTCGANVTKIEGEIVIEVPELNEAREKQYNVALTKYELNVQATKAISQTTPETFELLSGLPAPLFMKGVKLKTSGFLGEGATQSGKSTITLATDGELET